VSTLHVADVRPAQAGMLSQVVLIPALCLPKLPNTLSNSRTNISTCHISSMDVSFWLYFANWLHSQNLLLILEGAWGRG
jgi:hypothetical protein